jgi:hypothetical protein
MYIQNHMLARKKEHIKCDVEMNDLLLVWKSLILHNHLMHSTDQLNVWLTFSHRIFDKHLYLRHN